MSSRNTVVRTLHDLGLAAWFGGSLMGAVGVNGASRGMAVRDERSLDDGLLGVARHGHDRLDRAAAAAFAVQQVARPPAVPANVGGRPCLSSYGRAGLRPLCRHDRLAHA